MSASRRSLCATALLLLFPAIASAQATIAGTARDASGAVLPGVTVEAASPALIEKVRTVVTDGTRPVPDRRPAPRLVLGDLYAARLLHRQARGHRADRVVHRHRQRRPEARWSRGNDHGDRRIADRRRAERHRAARDAERGRSTRFRSGAATRAWPFSFQACRRRPASTRSCRTSAARITCGLPTPSRSTADARPTRTSRSTGSRSATSARSATSRTCFPTWARRRR